jgi:hypothetical protein
MHPSLLQERAAEIKALGGSRGTSGLNAIERAMQIREKPNAPVSHRFRSGLLFVGHVTV